MMRIVIDMQGAQSESRYRGIGRYTRSLVKAICEQQDGHNIYLVFNGLLRQSIAPLKDLFSSLVPQDNMLTFEGIGPVRESDAENGARREIAEQIFEKFISDLEPDIVHISSLFEGYVDDAITLIFNKDKTYKTSTILYDIIPYIYSNDYLESNYQYKEYYLRRIEYLKQIDIILSISESARNDGLIHLNLPPSRIYNVKGAPEKLFYRAEQALPVRLPIGEITSPYILYTGGADPRKNLLRLLRAYSELSVGFRENYVLVFAGGMPEGEIHRLRNEMVRLGLSESAVIFTGYVSDETLRSLYSACSLFVFPSWHEGLGLPALEAMRCGAPVIASNTSSMPEIIGWDEALFNPFDEVSITRKIHEALTDSTFTRKLRMNAENQAHKFTWEESARLALGALESDVGGSCTEPGFEAALQRRKIRYGSFIDALTLILRKHGERDDKLLGSLASSVAENEITADWVFRAQFELPERITWRIEGPFDSSYSLALLNRETARALSALGHNVSLYSTEGPGDFDPSDAFLTKNPDIRRLYERSAEKGPLQVDVVSRNLYPPRVRDMEARLNLLHHYAWEEAGFPSAWVEEFNDYLQGITCLSKHVEKILIDNGVTVPLLTSGCGVDHWERVEPSEYFKTEGKDFKFLHVSSCFPRKGAEILLKSFGTTFTKSDNVSLIIKTFSNPHNDVHKWLEREQANNGDYPDVIIIENDLTEAELKSLYNQCDALVAPSYAEGFGLPLAEAMLSGLPVITTGWGGQLDFCNEQTAWLIDFHFQPARTHFGLSDSVWAVPDIDDLSAKMLEVYRSSDVELKKRSDMGRQLLLDRCTWQSVAERLVSAARQWSQSGSSRSKPNIGWVTSWDTKCGIAAYSKHLIDNFRSDVKIFARIDQDQKGNYENNVDLSWTNDNSEGLANLYNSISKSNIDVLIVQFNYGFFDFKRLNWFINKNADDGRAIIIFLHATMDPAHAPDRRLDMLTPALERCKRILVHSHNDLNRLKQLGLVENVALFPHGVVDFETEKKRPDRQSTFKVATYGFFLPHKGLLEIIDAVSLIREQGSDIQLQMINAAYPAPISEDLITTAKHKIIERGMINHIQMNNNFLEDKASLELLEEADLLVFPYQNTGESSSAAVHYGLATGKPVAVTPLPIFDDVRQAVFELPGCSAMEIANGIMDIRQKLLSNEAEANAKLEHAKRWRNEHRYSSVARRLENMLIALTA